MLCRVYGLITAACLNQEVPPLRVAEPQPGHRADRLHRAPGLEDGRRWSLPAVYSSPGRPDVIRFLASFHSTFQAAFAQNTAGFHHSVELQFALPVMPVQSAASPLCQVNPAVPVLQLAHMRSLPSLLTEVLCNAAQTRADYASRSSLILKLHFSFFFSCMSTALQVLLDQSTKANSPLKGHERTVQYLQRLGKV